MKPLYTETQFMLSKSSDLLPLECYNCQQPFTTKKKYILLTLKNHSNPYNNYTNSCKFCSKDCLSKALTTKQKVRCHNCNTEFDKLLKEVKKSKNHFCSRSCNATYHNKNKSIGTKRSKLEIWLEAQLTTLYPDLSIDYNKKDAIGSELDIYIPSLRLAFELNGIFHCEPIFGEDKLNQIQTNDKLKFKACAENNITLCMIDTSKQKYFKESTSKQFLDIIIYHINWINLLANLPK